MTRSYLLTGGSGSFGRAFTRHLLDNGLSDRICIYSRGEAAQALMAEEFGHDERLRFLIGDVRDQERLEMAMRAVDVVVHAAALKVVPTCENDPIEAIKTNIVGTENVVKASLRAGIKKVMFISTDKASASSTLYGATKFAAERLVVASNVYSGADGTKFSCVRYGNVKMSRGAVYPFFKRLADSGAKSLPITDERMTRFFWELEDAVKFTLAGIDLMAGGEVFIPKIGARRIVDVAREIAPTLPHHIVGIRPGEKLHEVLISEDESLNAVEMQDMYVLCPSDATWDRSHLIGWEFVPDGFRFSSDSAIAQAAGREYLDAAE